MSSPLPEGLSLELPSPERIDQVLTPDALRFLARLENEFGERRRQLLRLRAERQRELLSGRLPDFLPDSPARSGDWKGPSIPADLRDRRVEITGPTDRKMIINALNSGANVFMADFEDSNSPAWKNLIQGQLNLRDAVRGSIDFTSPEGKQYRLKDKTATLMVRPRGWHLEEKHLKMNGRPVSGSLFDFAVFFFHNAKKLVEKGSGPYFYLPKMESHLEARLWNDVFNLSQDLLKVPRGTVRATVLIETILAAFEMEEILYELRDHSAGLNCGRWDYIFSFIKKFRHRPDFLLPDRAQVGMTCHFLRSYSQLLIQVCHRRGVHAMGGMAAQIPIKSDPKANEEALSKVRADKEREAGDGHDGTWVAHPDLVPVAKAIFDAKMKGPHQIENKRGDVRVTAQDLLTVPKGEITEAGLRTNIAVSILYLEAWLRGVGCVPIRHLMEDAATAEISRAQLWQWIHHAGKLSDGRRVTAELCRAIQREELERIRSEIGQERFAKGKFDLAGKLFDEFSTSDEFQEFLTLKAYEYL